jgi:DNA-binding NtrC family response regulator
MPAMRILVVDDEPKLGKLAAEMLSATGHTVSRALSGREAIGLLDASPFDLVITDLRMAEIDGMKVLEHARAKTPPPEVIMMTAHGSAESAVQAMKAGAVDYLVKPFSTDELRMRVSRIAAAHAAEERQSELVRRLSPSLVAESTAMKGVLAAARQVAPTDATVLILGESGTGKSELARYIHYFSDRSGGELVEVHCAALPDSLLESELFGYEKGAFTGAAQSRPGLLAGADRGSLFLDEIGEIHPTTQVKLLRFLQSREFVPVGSSEVRRIDARVLAATNRDLEAAVASGAFREDLYYRLNVFPIRVPPLRDRREDILPLAQHLLKARGVPLAKLTSETRAWMGEHTWPGNVRELENALERALILAAEDPISPEHLSLGARAPAGRAERIAENDLVARILDHAFSKEVSFEIDAFERALLYGAIERTGGNKAAAARAMGLTRRQMYSRLKGPAAGESTEDDDPAER